MVHNFGHEVSNTAGGGAWIVVVVVMCACVYVCVRARVRGVFGEDRSEG